MAFSKAYIRLAEIAERCRLNSSGLPAQQENIGTWTGIGFSMGGKRFVANLDDVAEVMPIPDYTAIPGAQNWMRGLANIRGRLLPVMDLMGFLNNPSTLNERLRRLLIVDNGDLYSGLVVDEVWGMQHFSIDSYSENKPPLWDEVKPYIKGVYRKEEENWLLFQVETLVDEPRFMQAAKIA